MDNTSVVDALKAANLWFDTGRIPVQTLVTVLPDGSQASHKMAEIDYKDIQTLGIELDVALKFENPYIQSLFAKNAMGIVNGMRAVNVDSASGFKGMVGSGRQLDFILFRPEQFFLGAAIRQTWQREIANASADVYFIEGSTSGSQLTMGDNECICLFGFADWAETPCVSAYQLEYLSQTYNIQNLNFQLTDYELHYPLVEMAEPLTVFPKETVRLKVCYNQAGTDYLTPIGLWIKMSSDLRSLGSG